MSDSAPEMLVAWDVDDVLNNLTLRWSDWAGFSISTTAPPTGDPSSWISSQGLEYGEYLRSLDDFRSSEYAGLQPNQAVLDVLREWPQAKTTHIALSATPIFAQSVVAAWTMKHFGEWLRAVWFCPSTRPGDPRSISLQSKGDVLRRIREPTLLVDDSVRNLESAEGTSATVLYPRAWNTLHSQEISAEELTSLLRLNQAKSGGTEDAHSG